MWLLFAKGSGIWFNTGKSLRCPDHSCASNELSELPVPDATLGDFFEAQKYFFDIHWTDELRSLPLQAACAAGITSLQFSDHPDVQDYYHPHGNYPCESRVGTYMNIEIVATCLAGTYACGVAGDGGGNPFKAGWHSKPCNCTNDADVLNCGHHTSDSSGSPSRRRTHPRPTVSPHASQPDILLV